MTDYSIERLYDEGYISGEVYYLCTENNIFYLEDAMPNFTNPQLPDYLEALKTVYKELCDGNVSKSSHNFSGWKEDCKKIAESYFNSANDRIDYFSSFAVFVKYVLSQDWLFGQYYVGGPFKDEIYKYWLSVQPENVDPDNAIWRTTCKQLLSTYTPFVRKAFSSLIDLYPDSNSFLNDLNSPSYVDEVLMIKGFGQSRKKLVSILVNEFISSVQVLSDDSSIVKNSSDIIPQDESLLEVFYQNSLRNYSVRACNALNTVLSEYDSYYNFFKWVLSPDFVPLKLRNVGRKAAQELNVWKGHIYDALILFDSNGNIKPSAIAVDETFTKVSPLKEDLFNDFFNFVESMKESRKGLAYSLINYESKDGLTGVASNINISRERVRQLLPVVLNDIRQFCLNRHGLYDYSKSEYFDMAKNCGRNIDDDFILWMGSLVSDEIGLIGSYERHICKGEPLIMVDGKLSSIFDFGLFVLKINLLSENKYYEETKVKIEDIVLDCFNGEVQFEFLPSIIRSCKTILYDHFPYHLSENEILIPANAYYSVRQRVEDILKKEGTPLTIDAIRNKLTESGSSFEGTDNQLVSMIRKSSLIVSFGYPCKYGLTTWGKPEEEVYGTIRDVAIHILLKHNPPILPEKDLVSALLAIYTESSERSIISNLMADSKQRFGLYQKGTASFVGLTNETYDPSFTLTIKGETKKTPTTSQKKISWQGTLDSIKRVMSKHSWTALDSQQRKWLINNWKKAQSGTLQEWQASQIFELIESNKKI